MSRLRTTLSQSPVDREIQAHVTTAERALAKALQACHTARDSEKYGQAHVARVRRDIERALGALQSVRRVTPMYDAADPDLQVSSESPDPDLQETAPYERPPEPVVEPVVVVDSEEGAL